MTCKNKDLDDLIDYEKSHIQNADVTLTNLYAGTHDAASYENTHLIVETVFFKTVEIK